MKPAQPMVRVEFNKERDMVRAEDTSPEHVAECQALYDKSGGFYNAGPFTPFMSTRTARRRRAPSPFRAAPAA